VNWPAVAEVLRKSMLENTKIIFEKYKNDDNDPLSQIFISAEEHDFSFVMFQTDTFHPFATDGDLQRSLERMPIRREYRKLKPYWEYKNRKESVIDSIFQCLEEMKENIEEWYSNSMNHAPGYIRPQDIIYKVDLETLAEKMFSKIRTAAMS
jgi:hypothetical protein